MLRWLPAMLAALLWAEAGLASTAVLAASEWNAYKKAFVREGRVVDVGHRGISHSEGQGYGLLLAWAAQDRAGFEAIWGWTQKNLQRQDRLFGWQWNATAEPPVRDWNNATDGDLLIAWALASAGEQWKRPEWIAEARAIAERVRTTLVVPTSFGPALLPAQYGFKSPVLTTLNPSYWVFPAFKALARVDPDPVWSSLTKSGQALLALARFGPHQLPPDWIDYLDEPRLALPSDPQRRRFGFEAIRVPLYLCWAGIRDPVLMRGFQAAWPGDDAPAWVDLVNGDRAAYPLTHGQRAIRQLVAACAGRSGGVTVGVDPNDYYGSTLALLAQLALARFGVSP
jgi:endoglucanase